MQSHKNALLTRGGEVVSGASVYVYNVGTITEATIYSDNGTTPITQPITTSDDGEYEFWAADGVYDVHITYSNATEDYEIVLFDPIRGGTTANHVIGGPVTPDTLLHIWKGSAGTVSAIANTVLTVENSTHAFISILTPNTSQGGVYFGDQDDNNRGGVVYDHNVSTLSLRVEDVTMIRTDADSTAGNTRLLIYDVDNATLERVSVGAADSGGAGFKVLRIPN